MMEKKLEIAIKTLQNIANPISYLRELAREMGETLDGRGAVEYANNGNNLSCMAKDALSEISKVKSAWTQYSEEKPPMGQEVIAYHPEWVDEDSNPKGIIIGWQGDNDFTSAHWWSYQDCYMTISHSECDDNQDFSEKTKNSIEPELWISLSQLTDYLTENKTEKQMCYKTGKPCEHDCKGLCKESY